jgi:WD40 repeat protein
MITHLHELRLPSDTATCHAWNTDNSLLACCHGTPIVAIYRIKLDSSDPVELVASLREHTQVVSSMQWSINNLLVTCSHDRTSYVWVQVCMEASASTVSTMQFRRGRCFAANERYTYAGWGVLDTADGHNPVAASCTVCSVGSEWEQVCSWEWDMQLLCLLL